MWLNFAGEMYMEMNGVKEICVLGFLGINSWIDIRKKQPSSAELWQLSDSRHYCHD